jgi:hypothetical protein
MIQPSLLPVADFDRLFVDQIEIDGVDIESPHEHSGILLGDHRLVKNYPAKKEQGTNVKTMMLMILERYDESGV